MLKPLYLLTLVILFAACGPQAAVTPPTERETLNGRWTGRAEDNIGAADVTLDLVASDTLLTGDVVLNFKLGFSSYSAEGTVEGSVTGDTIDLDIVPSDDKYCPYRATLIRAGEVMEGSYEGMGCKEAINGVLTLSRN